MTRGRLTLSSMRNAHTTFTGARWQLLASVCHGNRDGDFTRCSTQQGLGSVVSTKDRGTHRPWEGKPKDTVRHWKHWKGGREACMMHEMDKKGLRGMTATKLSLWASCHGFFHLYTVWSHTKMQCLLSAQTRCPQQPPPDPSTTVVGITFKGLKLGSSPENGACHNPYHMGWHALINAEVLRAVLGMWCVLHAC